jgi:DNA-binding MltR family transcriptional regulator
MDANRGIQALKYSFQFAQPAIAIWVSSVIEEALESNLFLKMRPISNKFRKRLFENYGPFSSFASKIDAAYAFSIVDENTFEDLNIIKEVRNGFAHPKTQLLRFEDEPIATILKKFKGYSKDNSEHIFLDKSISCLEVLHVNPQILVSVRGMSDIFSRVLSNKATANEAHT